MGTVTDAIRLLYVEEQAALERAEAAMGERTPPIEVTGTGPEAAGDRIAFGRFDAVVIGGDVAAAEGPSIAEAIREVEPDVPLFFYTDEGDESLARAAIDAGVTGYLVPPGDDFDDLADRIEAAARERRREGRRPGQSEQFRTLIEHGSDLITVLDEDGTVRYESPSIRRLGYEPDDLLGERVFEYVHPEDRERAADLFAELIGEPGYVTDGTELRFRRADGSWAWMESIGSNQRGTAIGGYVINSRIIDDRKREEQRFRRLIQEDTSLIRVLDRDGTVTYASPAAEDLLGYEPDELVGVSAREFAHSDDEERIVRAFERCVADPDHAPTVEYRIRHADGSWRRFESRLRNLLDDAAVGGIVVNSRDVTERSRREEELRRQNERLERFAGVLSHDLRNPLSVATGSLELYHETGEEAHYERVKHAHERIDSIIEDVLTLTRQGERVDDPEPVSLEEVASAAWRTVQTDDATLYVGGDATVEADPSRLQQLLENLFRNAIEHGPAGVCVHVGVTDDGFFVADDGRGIDPENRDAVFRPGYSTNEDGTGLGLSIVGEIAEAHGWSAAVAGHGDARSDDDGGACRAGAKIEISNVRFVGD